MKSNLRVEIKFEFNIKTILSLVIIGLLIISLFFSFYIEIFFKLRPNLLPLDNANFIFHVIDVGQGNCQAIQFSDGKKVIVDSGSDSSWNDLKIYLSKVFCTDKFIDYFILTHTDEDHIGNMYNILNSFNVGKVILPLDFFDTDGVGSELINMVNQFSESDIAYNIQGYEVDLNANEKILWLSPIDVSYDDENDYSPILLITTYNNKFMITGDATSLYGENQAINSGLVSDIDVDVLVLGHHGSKYSTSSTFLENVLPEYICISVGDNSYGHPSNEVMLRLIEYDSIYNKNTYNTMQITLINKNIIYFTNSNGLNQFNIDDINSYGFFPWWVVVMISVTGISLYTFVGLTHKRKK